MLELGLCANIVLGYSDRAPRRVLGAEGTIGTMCTECEIHCAECGVELHVINVLGIDLLVDEHEFTVAENTNGRGLHSHRPDRTKVRDHANA